MGRIAASKPSSRGEHQDTFVTTCSLGTYNCLPTVLNRTNRGSQKKERKKKEPQTMASVLRERSPSIVAVRGVHGTRQEPGSHERAAQGRNTVHIVSLYCNK